MVKTAVELELGFEIINIISERMDVSVYKVCRNKQCYLLKIHNKELPFKREVEAYTHFPKKGLPVPTLIQSGKISSQYYIVLEWWEGTTLLEAFPQMKPAKKEEVLYQAGQLLGTFHFCMTENEIKETKLWQYAYDGVTSYDDYAWENIFAKKFPLWIEKIRFKKEDNHKKLIEAFQVTEKEMKHFKFDSPIGIIHRDYGLRNLMIHDDKIKGIIDFEHTIVGDPVFDLTKLIFNDIDDEHDVHLRESFLDGWKKQSHMSIPNERLELYIAIQGVSTIQWVDKQPLQDQQQHQDFRHKGIKMLFTASELLS
ncbi:aminoglycoside phosphotransferase family protein [Longirhabdus pacifica]|uniref:aminoglycoside phosphotransferase family protein n=1 Tax=Longirhabdus pacifica TaxID=2305227 RepID=UPI001008FF4E|nr:aminoglycoside phosphotransferase family protein [Longirhabdus pacifica]